MNDDDQVEVSYYDHPTVQRLTRQVLRQYEVKSWSKSGTHYRPRVWIVPRAIYEASYAHGKA